MRARIPISNDDWSIWKRFVGVSSDLRWNDMSKTLTNKKEKTSHANTGAVYALIYARVSSEKQAREGHGLDAQEQRCREYAQRRGHLVSKENIFKDTASGGGEYTTRVGQVNLLKRVDQYPYRKFVVIVDDISRLARDVKAHITFREALKLRGVVMESPNFNFEDSPEGELYEGMTQLTNEYHRKVNKRQVVQKMKARLEAGYWPFGAKRGYRHVRVHGHGLLAVPSEEGLQVLKPALEAFASGNLQRKIDVCRYLVEKGFWRKQSPEKYIDKLTEILIDPFICGDIVYSRWEVDRRKGQHDALISREVFEKIQRRLKNDHVGKRIRTDVSDNFPLRGLILCSECEKPMTGAPTVKPDGTRYEYYYCQRKHCSMRGKTITREDAERDLRALLFRNRLKPKVDRIVAKVFDRVWSEETRNLDWEKQLVEDRRAELKQRIRKLTDLAVRAKVDSVRETYEAEIAAMNVELEKSESKTAAELDLSVPYQTALTKATGLLKNPLSIWDCVDVHEKHRLFFFLFEAKLTYSKKTGYQTGDSLCTARLFEEFVVANSQDVEVRGIEPRSKEKLSMRIYDA